MYKRQRYAFLFKLKITDYKGWARGLKKAGYATDPSYANRLITIIEAVSYTHLDVYKRQAYYPEGRYFLKLRLKSFYSSFIYGSFCKVIQKEESVYDW